MYCTNDNPNAPNFFKYLLCPNEAACESKVIYPNYNGEVLTRTVDTYANKFVNGDVCSYIIYSPWEMTEQDKMYLKIYDIKMAEVYLAKGKNMRWFNHLD